MVHAHLFKSVFPTTLMVGHSQVQPSLTQTKPLRSNSCTKPILSTLRSLEYLFSSFIIKTSCCERDIRRGKQIGEKTRAIRDRRQRQTHRRRWKHCLSNCFSWQLGTRLKIETNYRNTFLSGAR